MHMHCVLFFPLISQVCVDQYKLRYKILRFAQRKLRTIHIRCECGRKAIIAPNKCDMSIKYSELSKMIFLSFRPFDDEIGCIDVCYMLHRSYKLYTEPIPVNSIRTNTYLNASQ